MLDAPLNLEAEEFETQHNGFETIEAESGRSSAAIGGSTGVQAVSRILPVVMRAEMLV